LTDPEARPNVWINITAEADGWVAYVRLEDPPGLSPITTVDRFDTVEAAAQLATDEVWATR
jgi:hypothetical protein